MIQEGSVKTKRDLALAKTDLHYATAILQATGAIA